MIEMNQDRLSLGKKLSYGVGHVLNDLSASMWFSYLLIYLHRVVDFKNSLSGYMMLLGQVADAISTAFVGFESDRTQNGFCNYGRRKSWHLVGCVCVLFSFPFLFNLCIDCENSPEWARFYYYAPFVVIFQFGWAATQISHLSLLPQLTPNENERVALNAIRYAFTVASNLTVYVATYLLLKIDNSHDDPQPHPHLDDSNDDSDLSRADAPKFMYMSLIVCSLGLVFQILFHVGTNERNLLTDEQIRDHSMPNSIEVKLDWAGYLKNFRFYNVAVLYMSTRLIVNMTQVYMPMYLTDTLELDKSYIALIPLICYISGFLSTFPLRYFNKLVGPYVTYLIGISLSSISGGLFWFQDLIYNKNWNTITSAILLGCGCTIILVTSLSITADLIGKNTGSGAFVYGAMSFTDKLSNGVIVAFLQQFSPCQYHTVTCSCKGYYHRIMAILPPSCSVVAAIAVISLYIYRPKQTRNLVLTADEDERLSIIPKSDTFDYGSIN